ncbi:acetoacetate decarboxylase [Burkholderia multivorans]|nr:acetoacetate decarboxylase [Burkholderia multivorans]MCO1342605.1 acetoacetate decarboxylase [Burkholderia multivorans]MCO1443357.1 acetoacetate decarboxylase [Burkholderia multivorans]UQO30018.1 acetoacetate decarboxylase [Burkholderia multivorans]UQO43191.1 acetoacetate decarboxylase [Burkholderia multivorans]HEF5153889.1 acetoacetate decarboxylase [Burkholderia multivorans]
MDKRFTQVEFGTHKVEVPAGGYYDRYRMNPDLDEVARDPAAGNIDFFRRIPKRLVASTVGPTWAPNFYYRSSHVQLLFLAPADRLRAMLPIPLEPLRAYPGRGLVALTFFSYAVCDNDPYDEVSVAVVVRRPGARGPHALELLDSMRRRSFHAHVLALPVTTEIARVRGLYGYQLPKWRTEIGVSIGADVKASIAGPGGKADLTLRASLPVLRNVPSQSHMATATMVNQIDGEWHQTRVQTNMLSFAQRLFPRDVRLARHGGPLSQLLDGLGASTVLRMDVVKDAQVVLNMPTRLDTFTSVT